MASFYKGAGKTIFLLNKEEEGDKDDLTRLSGLMIIEGAFAKVDTAKRPKRQRADSPLSASVVPLEAQA